MGFFDRFRRRHEPPPPRGSLWTRDAIVPVIKDAIFVARYETSLGNYLLKRHLCSDLWVLYAADMPAGLEFLEREDALRFGLDPDAMHTAAIENLRTKLPQIERHGDLGAERILCGGKLEASLLLVDELWEEIAEDVSGELVAAVPAGPMLIFTGSAVPGGVERIRQAAEKASASGPLALSSTLLRWNGAGWDLWR